MNPLTQRQIEFNARSRDGWDVFGLHRDKVTALLRTVPVVAKLRLCVLGAGNCNDLDLATLLHTFQEIHLVDLDAEALTHGVARQGLENNPAVRTHGGLDVTGVFDELAGWSPQTVLRDEDLRACMERPVRMLAATLSGPFDVVASTCLLSQLVLSVVRTVGEAHPRFLEAIQAIRAGHLRLLANLVAPGGTGVLITDVVSSDTFPPLGSVPDASLPQVLAKLIADHNFFHGVNPAVLARFFRTDPVVAPQVTALEMVPPWLWDLGPRVYAVCALTFRIRGDPPSKT